MNIEKQLKESLSQALTHLYDISLDANDLALQPTRREFLGTHTFVTFPIAKRAKKNPQEVAEDLGRHLRENMWEQPGCMAASRDRTPAQAGYWVRMKCLAPSWLAAVD